MKTLLLLLACMLMVGALPARADLVQPSQEPWAFTAPMPRSQQSPQGVAATPASLDRDARQYFDAAMQSMVSNQLDQAALEIQKVLTLAPDHPSVLAIAGRIFARQRSFGLAANCWRQLLAAYPGQPTVRAELAATLLYMGKEKEARAELDQALGVAPGDITVRYYQGLFLVKERAFDQASEVFYSLTGPQVLQTLTRLQEDRDLIVALTSTEGYRNMARAVLGSKTGGEMEKEIGKVKQLLLEAQPYLMKSQYAEALPRLEAIYQTGARFPALEYDLGLCRYNQEPGPVHLDELEQLATSPRGVGIRRLFGYLCLNVNDAQRADRALRSILETERDPESLLLRAAIRQSLNDEPGAWALLSTIPPNYRPATLPWFERPVPAIQALKSSPTFASWLKTSAEETQTFQQ